ncbi:hypothetical protein CN326_20725 [Bacillus sp. AFS018417]|nr:hypothetical protein CN326_20725 [Bacillus sp. AFS018417]
MRRTLKNLHPQNKKLFSARFAFFAKPTDKTQDNGYRLGLAIIRAEPLRSIALKLFVFKLLIRLNTWGFVPTRRASTLTKTQIVNQKLIEIIKDHVLFHKS